MLGTAVNNVNNGSSIRAAERHNGAREIILAAPLNKGDVWERCCSRKKILKISHEQWHKLENVALFPTFSDL